MAIDTPTLSKANPEAAVQVQTEVASPIPDIIANAVGAGLQVNKENQIKAIRSEFETLSGQLQSTVLGDRAVLSAPSKKALEDFEKTAKRLSRAEAVLDPIRYRTEAERTLRKFQAQAPGLSDEFRAVARDTLGFDPTGSADREAFAALQAEQTKNKNVFDDLLDIGKRLKRFDLVSAAIQGSITPQQYAQEIQVVANAEASRDSLIKEIDLGMKVNAFSDEQGKRRAFSMANKIVKDNAALFRTDLASFLPQETQDAWAQAVATNNIASLSGDDRTAILDAISSVEQSYNTSLRPLLNVMNTDDRKKVQETLDLAKKPYIDLLEGKTTAAATEQVLNSLSNSVIQDAMLNNEDPNNRALLAMLAADKAGLDISQHLYSMSVNAGAAFANGISGKLDGTALETMQNETSTDGKGKAKPAVEVYYDITEAALDAPGELPDDVVPSIENFIEVQSSNLDNALTPRQAARALTLLDKAHKAVAKKKGASDETAKQIAIEQVNKIRGDALTAVGKSLGRAAEATNLRIEVQNGKIIARNSKTGMTTQQEQEALADIGVTPKNIVELNKRIQQFNALGVGFVSDGDPNEGLRAIANQYLLRNPEKRDHLSNQMRKLVEERESLGDFGGSAQVRKQELEEQIKSLQEQLRNL